jgi:two-component system sensor histidine kinase DegS
VTVVIEDDGVGFAPVSGRGDGLGLGGMHERVALVDGRLEIESREGTGTTLRIEVPLR